MRGLCFRHKEAIRTLAILVLALSCTLISTTVEAFQPFEILRYEFLWNGNKAGHGDVMTKAESGQVNVTAQAVSDGVLKRILEIWSRIQASFSARTFQPKKYTYVLKSNLGGIETVDLSFDHSTNLVQVNKRKGDERESHAERFSGIYDPITAVYLLRSQRDFSKPLFVDIYDGKDKARLAVSRIGEEPCQVRGGVHQALCLNLKLTRLGGDGQEIGTAKLWISNDQNRIPLLLTSSHLVGTLRFELVQLEFTDQTSKDSDMSSSSPQALTRVKGDAKR